MPGILVEISLPLDNFCAVIEVDDAAALHSINGRSMRVLTLLYSVHGTMQVSTQHSYSTTSINPVFTAIADFTVAYAANFQFFLYCKATVNLILHSNL